jgi:hypothetical protein
MIAPGVETSGVAAGGKPGIEVDGEAGLGDGGGVACGIGG